MTQTHTICSHSPSAVSCPRPPLQFRTEGKFFAGFPPSPRLEGSCLSSGKEPRPHGVPPARAPAAACRNGRVRARDPAGPSRKGIARGVRPRATQTSWLPARALSDPSLPPLHPPTRERERESKRERKGEPGEREGEREGGRGGGISSEIYSY